MLTERSLELDWWSAGESSRFYRRPRRMERQADCNCPEFRWQAADL